MPRRQPDQPHDADDLLRPRRSRVDATEVDDVVDLDVAPTDGAQTQGLLDAPGSAIQFGQNLLSATGRGFAQFGENIAEHLQEGVKGHLANGVEAVKNLTGLGDDGGDTSGGDADGGDTADGEGEGSGGEGDAGEGGGTSTQSGSAGGGTGLGPVGLDPGGLGAGHAGLSLAFDDLGPIADPGAMELRDDLGDDLIDGADGDLGLID